MAHEKILPAIQMLLIADGAPKDFTARITDVIKQESRFIAVQDASKAIGVPLRTCWRIIKNQGIECIPGRGRGPTRVDYDSLKAATEVPA